VAVLKLDGPVGIQVKRSQQGDFKILEINPRIQGTSVAAMGVGINLPLLAVNHAMKQPLNIDHQNIPWGRKFSRYWSEVFHD
jgi:carbamoyl-phosphate synthase large subunit